MSLLLLFALQLCIPLALGIGATVYLRGVTHDLLRDICGTEDRAEFWVRITALLMTTAPSILVLLFGYPANTVSASPDAIYTILRQTLWLSLGGILAAVTMLARTIWQQIPQRPASASPIPAQSSVPDTGARPCAS